jgi:hypothetical protein
MTISQNDEIVLKELLRNMSKGELSTLIASFAEPGSLIGTSKNGTNYAFLSKLVELGIAEEKTLDVELPPEQKYCLSRFLPKVTTKTNLFLRGFRG